MFTVQGWIAIGVVFAVFSLLLLRRRLQVEILFLGALLAVTLTGIISPAQALAGFATPAVIAIAALYVVATGLRNTGVLDWVGHKLLGHVTSEGAAMRRLAMVLVSTSAFLLNTALVAMMVPVVLDWCRKNKISPSKLMIPVSYFAILGGVCSLIGTSTTLIVNSTLLEQQTAQQQALNQQIAEWNRNGGLTDNQREYQDREQAYIQSIHPMGLFEITQVGLPCAVVGTFVLLLLRSKLLPKRVEVFDRLVKEQRKYLVDMRVLPDCRLVGQTVEKAGLRNLPGLFLIEIDRDSPDKEVITPVSPEDVIHAGDRMVFTGVVDTIVDLKNIPGLESAEDAAEGIHGKQSRRQLVEAVLSRSSPLINRTVRQSDFRRRYSAAVIAVHRSGERLPTKIGEIVLEPGDTLLLQTRDNFVKRHRNDPAFYLVSPVSGYSPRRHNKAWLAGSLGILLVLWLIIANLDFAPAAMKLNGYPAVAAMAVAFAMIGTRCVSVSDARGAINLPVLITIVGALALGRALDESGAAKVIATFLVGFFGNNHPLMLLVIVYLMGMVFTELITNNAVAALLIPISIQVAKSSNQDPRPFILAIALSASLAFLTPVGYQTNLMVMGPGGYHPRDFLKAGFIVSLSVGVTAIALIYLFWLR